MPRGKRGLTRRLLVLKAGSGPSNNLVRSLRAGVPSSFIVGCHEDPFFLRRSPADRNYLLPPSTQPGFVAALCRLIKSEHIDLVIPNSEADVTAISTLREDLPCGVFLPRKDVIERCQDKYELTMFLRRCGLPVPLTFPITALKDIGKLYRRLPAGFPMWCRIRKGSGSIGAIPVRSAEHVRSWIKYWQEMRAIPPGSFTLSEYLPGSDYCVQSLWKEGKLTLTKMHQRLSYFVAGSSASGVSSSAAIAKMVFVPRIFAICSKAIRALDPRASGVYFVDLKKNADGVPCITEINAGRFANVSTIHDVAVKRNMAATYVRLALGERVRFREARERASHGHIIMRDLDGLPWIFRGGELYHGIEAGSGRRQR